MRVQVLRHLADDFAPACQRVGRVLIFHGGIPHIAFAARYPPVPSVSRRRQHHRVLNAHRPRQMDNGRIGADHEIQMRHQARQIRQAADFIGKLRDAVFFQPLFFCGGEVLLQAHPMRVGRGCGSTGTRR